MIHDDRPIGIANEQEDRLDRKSFASRIVKSLKTLPDDASLTVSIEAPWGTGKTSVINLIKGYLINEPEELRPIIVNFNPWVIGHFEQLAQAFIIQLAAALELQDFAGQGTKAAKELIAYSKVFDVLKLIPGAEPWASLVKSVVESVGGVSETVSGLKNLDLAKRKSEVESALKAINRRIIVFVDDLDRLPPEDVAEMIRLIKAIGDFPYIVYFLAFDSHYIEGALNARKIPGAGSYLDKVVQVRLHVPQADKNQLMQLVEQEYALISDDAKQAFAKTDDRVSELFFYGLRELIETPRDVKRLFNRMLFSEPPCRGEVALGDLIALEAIALKAPSVYHHIRAVPEAYVGKPLYQVFSLEDTEKLIASSNEERQRIISELPIGIRRPIQRLLRNLFPLTALNTFNQKANASVLGLIQDPSRLAIALSVGIPQKEAPLKHAYALLQKPDLREEILNEVLATARFSSLIGHLATLVDEPVVDLPGLAVSLGRALDTREARDLESSSDDFMLLRPIRQVWNYIEEKLEQNSQDYIFSVILAMAKSRDCISLTSQALSKYSELLKSSDSKGQHCEWGTAQDWRDLVVRWSDNVKTWISAGKLHELALGRFSLQCFLEWGGTEAASEISALFSTDQGTDQVMLTFSDNGADTRGSYLELHESSLEPFGGRAALIDKARERLADPKLSHRLRVVYQAVMTGKRIYSADATIG